MKISQYLAVAGAVLLTALTSGAVPMDPPGWKKQAAAEVVVAVKRVSKHCLVSARVLQVVTKKAGSAVAKGKTIRFTVNCRQSPTPPEGPISIYVKDLQKAKYMHAFLFKNGAGKPFATNYINANAHVTILKRPTLPTTK